MRKSIAALLSALTLIIGMPIIGMAQGSGVATVRGQVVSAGGLGQTGLVVELVRNQVVVNSTVTGGDGHFAFTGLTAGTYTVRTTINGQPTGVRVSAVSGTTTPALIVLPSLATASPGVIVAVIGPALSSIVVATVSVVANQVVVTTSSNSDQQFVFESQTAAQEFLQDLNNQLPPPPPGQPPPFQFIPTQPASNPS